MKPVTHESLSLGEWTLPHALASLIVIEQIYRVTNLLAGGKYHH
jgi:23S rRNA pseudoU1915 N3-methylase RlmH